AVQRRTTSRSRCYGLGGRDRSPASRSNLRAVFHDKARWDGHGPGDLPRYRRSMWGPALGDCEPGFWHDCSLRRSGCRHRRYMNARPGKVFVVDDDVTVCVALSRLTRTAGLHVETFGTAAECLSDDRLKDADCLVLDVHLPDLSGLELQEKLSELGLELPIVFITGRGDLPMSVRAMQPPAVEFLTNPFDNHQL